LIDPMFTERFLVGFITSVLMFFACEFLIVVLKIKNHKQKSNVYILALFSSFSIMLYALFFFDIKRIGDSLFLFFPNAMKDLEVTLSVNFIEVREGFKLLNFRLALLALFLISLLLFVSLLLVSRIYIKKKYNLKPCKDGRVLHLLKTICCENSLRIPETMMFRGTVNAFIFGFPPVLTVSEELMGNVNERELELVLRHEINHIKNHDNILKPLLFSLRILFFYNPCVHILIQWITKEREFLADKVSEMRKEKVIFLHTLVKLSELQSAKKQLFFPSFISSPLVKPNLKMRTETLLSDDRRCRINPYIILLWFFLILIFAGTYASGNLHFQGREGLEENTGTFHGPAPEMIFSEEESSKKEFLQMISENFPPHPHMYNTMPPIFPEQRNSNGIINFPPPPEEVKAITPPQLYIIKTRILLATFLLIPLLFFSSRLLTNCILRRKCL
jgi:beta-lactamase regulating signal transducer with metallopeptidase domain